MHRKSLLPAALVLAAATLFCDRALAQPLGAEVVPAEPREEAASAVPPANEYEVLIADLGARKQAIEADTSIEEAVRTILRSRSDVAVSSKHFPMCADCNVYMNGRTLHANACWRRAT